MTRFALAAVALAALSLSACDSADPTPVPLNVQTVSDIAADPGPRVNGQVQATGRFALYSLRENRLVLGVDNANRADSTSTAWDIGFRGTEIIFNGGASGPGEAEAQLVNRPFAEVTEAPADGYLADGDNTACEPSGRVLCPLSDRGWYSYTLFTPGNQAGGGYIAPRAGYTIVLRNADGATYSKVRILSYYRGNPAPSTITRDSEERFYTFEFVTQPDRDSRSFTTTTVQP